MHSRIISSLSIVLAVLAVADRAEAQVRTFHGPTHGGLAVSYCGADTASCGEATAGQWCRSQGYELARDWAAMPGVDAATTTVRLDDNAVCRGAHCEAFASITCEREGRSFRMPRLGAAGMATVISPSRRNAEAAFQATEVEVPLSGCYQREPGIFVCETLPEYRQCRQLMAAGRVFSCRAGLAFDGSIAEAVAASPDDYTLEIGSTAEVRVQQGERGQGRVRGDVQAEIRFDPPREQGTWCIERQPYVYHLTGPDGGTADVGRATACEEPIQVRYAPNEDHAVMAYDLCNTFAAWGSRIEQPIEVLVAALFEIGSASPRFLQRHGASTAVIASYATVKAPLGIDCRD